MPKFVPGQKIVRLEGLEKGRKWPDKWAHKPVTVLNATNERVWFQQPELINNLGWLASRFISEDDPDYKPLKRFF